MSNVLQCNMCFQKAGREISRYVITNCGHVFCEHCLQKGRKGVCGVCKSPCRTIVLSDETDPEIKMLFTDIGDLCQQYSKEFSQVAEFQACHRQRSLVHYKRKISKLEETVKELTQQLQSCSLRASQSCSRMPASNTVKSKDSTHSHDQYSPSFSQASSTKKAEVADFTSNASQNKNFPITGLTRLSLISPPASGITGVYKGNTSGGSTRSSVGSSRQSIFNPFSQSVSPANQDRVWHFPSQRSPQTPLSTQSSSSRQPITLANVLQRRQ
ncbi:putative E3 SUMO-protein ligase RNF212 [Leptodactylus fuscus]|uniref:putative E3 SUMO-protein ligase RNF212 n=1 Tax=Leptodactylus fuscus TaxID=238119 RepID=UPI003F4F19D5